MIQILSISYSIFNDYCKEIEKEIGLRICNNNSGNK